MGIGSMSDGMRLASRLVLLAVAGLAAGGQAQPATTQVTGDDLAQRLEEIDRRAGTVRDLVADFEQRKFSPLLTEPIVTRGQIRSKGAMVLWSGETPEPTRTRVTLERLQIYYVKQNVLEEYPIGGKLGSLAASPLPRLATLRERFTMTRDDGTDLPAPPGAANLLAIRLTPIEDEVRQYVDHIRVLLDADRGLVAAFELVDPDGERTTIRFSNVRTNSGFPDAELELGTPRDVKVVRPLGPGRADTP